MEKQKFSCDDYTVAWICALEKESLAATLMLDKEHPDLPIVENRESANTYTLGSISTNAGDHNVVIACLPESSYGTNEAAIAATQIFNTFPNIRFCLMVGIGGGIPPEVRLGSVVVGVTVQQWDFGKEEIKFRSTSEATKSCRFLRTVIPKVKTNYRIRGKSKIVQYLDGIKGKFESLEDEAMYTWSRSRIDPEVTSEVQSKPVEGQPDSKQPKPNIHYGLIASGNSVVKNKGTRDKIIERVGKDVLCIEMEAAGLTNFPSLVIRGICDYADERKNDDWQEYAAATAAAYAKEFLGYISPCEIEQETPIKELTNKVENIQSSINDIKIKLEGNEQHKILNWLSDSNYAVRHDAILAKKQSGTGEWFLESLQYKSWVEGRHILFCPGIPGAGKTILASMVIEDLESRFSRNPNVKSPVGIAYIYFEFKPSNAQDINSLLAVLVKQLAQSLPIPPTRVETLYQKHSNKGTRPSYEELLEILKEIINLYSKVFVVIDALDEYNDDDDRAAFLSDLFKLHEKCEMNFLATSRPIPLIEQKFKNSLRIEIVADQEDMRKYLDQMASKSASWGRKCKGKDESDMKSSIIKVSRGMFLITQLLFNLLKGKESFGKMKKTLDLLDVSEGNSHLLYHEVYNYTIERIQSSKQGGDMARQVLSWVICAKRPLTIRELGYAIAIQNNQTEFDDDYLPDLPSMIAACAGLVIIDEGGDTVRLVHHTTQQYFEGTQNRWLNIPCAHAGIALKCITVLSYSSYIISPTSRVIEVHDKAAEIDRVDPLFRYAAENWGHHAYSSSVGAAQWLLDFLQNEGAIGMSYYLIFRPTEGWFFHLILKPDYIYRPSGGNLAAYFGLTDIIATMLDKFGGPGVNSGDGYGNTMLHCAVRGKHLAVVKVLLERGADQNLRNDIGWTPMQEAVLRGLADIVKMLLEKGGDPNSIAMQRDTIPLIELTQRERRRKELPDSRVVSPLLRKSRKIDCMSVNSDETGLASPGEAEPVTLKTLIFGKSLQHIFDECCIMAKKRVPILHIAAQESNAEVTELLLRHGANIKARDDEEMSALCWAAALGNEEVVKVLIEHDIDNTRDFKRTAFHLVKEWCSLEWILKLLY